MLTVILLFAGLILVVGLVFLVMKSGARGKRLEMSADAEVTKQHEQGGRGRPVI